LQKFSYKLAFGQLFEAVSTTASGWLGAFAATGIEIAGVRAGAALQRQASETRIEGQAQAETTRATANKEAGDLQARAHQLQGLQSAAANRSQALGAIAGSYALARQMNEAQRQASTGLLEQSRQQQLAQLGAERSFGQRQTGIQTSREERELRLTQGQQNANTLIQRTADTGEQAVTGLSRLGGDSMPLLPAVPSAFQMLTGPARSAAEISLNNATTAARVDSARMAGQSQVENYEFTTELRAGAANHYAAQATQITNQQAAANTAAARAGRDLAAGGVATAYHQQVQGVTQAYQLSMQANQANLGGALQAAELVRSAGLKAVKLEQMSQLVNTLSRDLARRTEQALIWRY
jgi:hypothetical protein